ncbi:MAG TPA: DUF429 domain-containing protein [Thermosynechococcaceae cyanobacterium]
MKFLGIDLGWSSGASGLCCLEWQDDRLVLLDLQCQTATPDILSWIDRWITSTEASGIAVDAPTLIPNATGMRLCDRLTHQHFGRYHAGSYPANLGSAFASRTVEFGRSLEARGFAHAPEMQPRQPGRFQIEVFPHPATIYLFGLIQILKYKKGKLADRRSHLDRLRQHILNILPTLEPALAPVMLPDLPQKGTALKAIEDQLDSLLCAYIAAHWWYWGEERNWVLGDRTTGYIIVPGRPEIEKKGA